MTDRVIHFFVAGIPRPGGSKKIFGIRKGGIHTGRFIVTDAGGQANKDWRASVVHEGSLAMEGRHLLTGPLKVTLSFGMPRPKAHFRANGEVKENAPHYHANAPDLLKLTRTIEDALTKVVWFDDSQIVVERLRKLYDDQVGCYVVVEQLLA
jgi:Holliday junction resolvase RusA-like endonuclease